MSANDLTVLIDGSYALHRVLRVGGDASPFAHLTSSDGIPTGGAFGYLLTLSRSLSTFNIKSVVNVWDSGIYSARRLKLLETYKGGRTATRCTQEGREYHENFMNQKVMVVEFLKALGIPSVTIQNKEADDVIGFLSRHIAGSVMVLSDDKDYWQLINDRVCVYRPVRGKYLDLHNFSVESGFRAPWRYLLHCAMVGDDGDDVPGIPKIGGTTATKVANAAIAPTRVAVAQACRVLAETDTRSASRFKKVASNFAIISRNYQLLDLLREEFSKDDLSSLQTQMDTCHHPNDFAVLSSLKKYDMQSIADKLSNWIMPFRRLTKPTFEVK